MGFLSIIVYFIMLMLVSTTVTIILTLIERLRVTRRNKKQKRSEKLNDAAKGKVW